MKIKKDKNNLYRISFSVLCLVFLFTLLTSFSNKANASSDVYIDNQIYDFGTVLEGKEIPYDFIVENRGNEPFRILNARSNCACAEILSYSEEIFPGQKGKVSVIIHSKGANGTVDYRIRVKTGDTNKDHLDLRVTGHIEPIVRITPKEAILMGKKGENIKAELIISSDLNHFFKITSAESKKGKVSLNLEKIKDPESSTYRLTVTNLCKEKGKYLDYIYLHTNSSIRPNISIKVKGDIR